MADSVKVIIETILKDKAFQQGLANMQKKASKTSEAFGKVKGMLAGIGAGLAARSAIKVMAGFEQSIANVASVSGGARKELESMARAAGKTTVFSASEAADAMYFLASAGLEVKDMNQVLTPTLDLAAAANMGIAESTDMVVNNLKVFQADMSQAANFTDIMAKTVSSANLDMKQLGTALSFSASAAAQNGMDFKELNVVLAALADKGIKGTRAGRQLRQAFARLNAPTEKAKAILDKYNISQEQLSEAMSDPIKLFKLLEPAVQDSGEALELFGSEQADVVGLIKSGIPALEDLTSKINDAGGAAKSMAETQIDTLEGAIKLLKSAFEELLLAVGEDLLPLLKDGILFVKDAVKGFNSMPKPIKMTTVAVVALTAAALALNAALGPIGLVLGGISVAALGAAAAYGRMNKETEAMIEPTTELADSLKDISDVIENAQKTDIAVTFSDGAKAVTNLTDNIAALDARIEQLREKQKAPIFSFDQAQVEKERMAIKIQLEEALKERQRIAVLMAEIERKQAEEAAGIREEQTAAEKAAVAEALELARERAEKLREVREDFYAFVGENEQKMIEDIQEARDANLASLAEFTEEELLMIGGKQEAIVLINQTAEEQITAIQEAENEKRKKTALGYFNTVSSGLQGMMSSWTSVASTIKDIEIEKYNAIDEADTAARKKQGKRVERAARAEKALNIVNTIMATAQASMKAYQSMAGIPYVGPILGAIAAAAATAAGAVQIAKIKRQKIPAFETGTEKVSATGPAIVHKDERIIPAEMNIRGVSNRQLMAAAARGLPSLGSTRVVNDERSYDNSKTVSVGNVNFTLTGGITREEFDEMMVDFNDRTGG
jgi:TP901 family phage tail tape measure protein